MELSIIKRTATTATVLVSLADSKEAAIDGAVELTRYPIIRRVRDWKNGSYTITTETPAK